MSIYILKRGYNIFSCDEYGIIFYFFFYFILIYDRSIEQIFNIDRFILNSKDIMGFS